MKRIVVYGIGHMGKVFYKLISRYKEDGCKIVGYTNTDGRADMEIPGNCPFINRENMNDGVADLCIVAINSRTEYRKILAFFLQKEIFDVHKIIYWEDFMNHLRKEKLFEKYRTCEDKEIKDTLRWLETHALTVRNQYENSEKIYYEVFEDRENGFPYIIFHGHRMYYPRTSKFIEKDGRRWIINAVEDDQYPGSPHLYVTDSHMVMPQGVLVDAGAAEGTFILSYIDIIKKGYVFEYEPRWLEALELTLRPFKDKVVIIPKKLSDYNSDECITLDSAVTEEIDFLKMDIEGAEVCAVLGGMGLLKRSNAKVSICTYHRQYDEKYLTFLLQSLGYDIAFTNGKLFFTYDDNIDDSLDFRHGVIYGEKKQGEQI